MDVFSMAPHVRHKITVPAKVDPYEYVNGCSNLAERMPFILPYGSRT